MTERPAILLFDGTCGFCARNVQFVLGHERRDRSLRFASLQSGVGTELYARHADLRDVDSVIWVEPGDASDGAHPERVLVRSAAVLRVLQYLGGGWAILGAIGAFVPRVLRDAVYDFVARHRHQLIRGDASCLLPTAEQQTRFIG